MTSNTQSTLPPGPDLIERIDGVATDLCDQSDGYGDRIELMAALKRFVKRNVASVEPDSLSNIHIEHALFRYGLPGEDCYDVLSSHFTDQQIHDLVDALELFAKRPDLCWVCEETTSTSTFSTDEPVAKAVVSELEEDPEKINLCAGCAAEVESHGWEPDDSGSPGVRHSRRRRW